jgi:hypothetical protein
MRFGDALTDETSSNRVALPLLSGSRVTPDKITNRSFRSRRPTTRDPTRCDRLRKHDSFVL